MQKFKSKKGFTLAELLIVVAIIAVLTAIAVPLFVGSLNKAEKNVENANITAVREAAVTEILTSDDPDYRHVESGDELVLANAWVINAFVTVNGDIHDMTIVASTNGELKQATCEKLKNDGDHAPGKKGEYWVYIIINELKPV